MDVILIPGFWLTAESWAPVVPALESAGHRVRALTLPGKGPEGGAAEVGLADHVAAVVAAVDEAEGPVVLVGHSGGGAIAHAAVDARPDRVARVVYVDAVPLGDGSVINDQLPVVDGVIPLPDWSVFGPEDLIDLDDELRARFRAIAVPEPARVATDRQVLRDPRRYDVPITVITTSPRRTPWRASVPASRADLSATSPNEAGGVRIQIRGSERYWCEMARSSVAGFIAALGRRTPKRPLWRRRAVRRAALRCTARSNLARTSAAHRPAPRR